MRTLLFLGLVVAGDAALRTSMKSKYAEANVAAAEVGRRCTALDFSGAVDVLEAHSRPVGWQLGKQLLKTCFMDKEGQCLLGKTKCAWMQKCFSAEGPCGQPPIKDSFLEIEGGQVAYAGLEEEAKQAPPVADPLAQMKAKSGDWRVGVPTFQLDQLSKMAKTLAKRLPERMKYNLLLAKGARDVYFDYVPEQKKRLWFYKLGSLGLWFLLACATEYGTIKMMGVGGNAQPVYAWFAPMGIWKDPAYTYPIFESKFQKKTEDWDC